MKVKCGVRHLDTLENFVGITTAGKVEHNALHHGTCAVSLTEGHWRFGYADEQSSPGYNCQEYP